MKTFLVLTSAAVLLAAAVVLPVGASAPRLDAEALSVGSGPGRAVRLSERRSAEARDRDKTGTSGVREIIEGPQPVDLQEVTGLRSLLPERGGFEPPVRLPVHWFSKPAPSATRTPLQYCFDLNSRS